MLRPILSWVNGAVTRTTNRQSDGVDRHLPQYTVGVVAERLGVPIATLRSWNQRYGVGPHGHSPGRHRLYSENDIQIVEQMHQLVGSGTNPRSAARTVLDAATPPRADTERLLAAALALDVVGVERHLATHLHHFGAVDTWDQLIRPVFAEIDARQVGGERCIDVEHALSWAVARAFQRITVAPHDRRISTLLACAEHETHTLPLEALRAALAEREIGTLMLGADVPAGAILDAVGRNSGTPTVVLWAQAAGTADAATARAIAAAPARLVVCGPGWLSTRLPRNVVRVDSLQDAIGSVSGAT